jgi:hypothetical protein
MGVLAAATSARSLSTSHQTLRAAFRTVTFNGVFGDIRCAVTVEGSFHSRTIPKVVALTGYITTAILGTCAEGTASLLRETLPWHIRYSGFAGTLPNITSLRASIVGVSFRIREPFVTCLATTTSEKPGVITFNREIATGVVSTAELSGRIPTTCGSEGSFSSTRDAVTTPEGTRITLTLI